MHNRTFLSVLPALLMVGACTVGPNYAGPPPVLQTPPTGGTGGFVRAGASASNAAPGLAQWWTALGDPVLDQLERRALAGSPDIATARARFDQAGTALRTEKLSGTPAVSAVGLGADARIPGLTGDGTVQYYNLALSAQWELDLFGGERRKTEAARYALESAEADAADAQVSLTSAIAQSYLQYRDRQQRIVLANEAIARRESMLGIARERFEHGVATQTDVEQAQSRLEEARQKLSPLQAEADGFANALAILAGETPGAVDSLLAGTSAIPLPPSDVAIGDPAALLQRRPDIRSAERKLAAENARIGVAEAARFPRLTFFGILGVGGTSPEDLTHLDDFTAIGLPVVQWNFLDFGRAKVKVEQAEAKRDEVEAKYKGVVLGALRDVEDALANFRAAREVVASQARARASAASMVQLAQQRFDVGTASQAQLLDAQLADNAAQALLVQSRAKLTIAFIALEKALGLGWEAGQPAA